MSRWVGRRIYREIRACCWTISHHQAPFYILFDWSDLWEFDHTWGKLRTVPQLSPGEDSWRSRVQYRLKRVRSICHCHPTCNKSVFLVNMGHIEGWNRRQIKNWEKRKKKEKNCDTEEEISYFLNVDLDFVLELPQLSIKCHSFVLFTV